MASRFGRHIATPEEGAAAVSWLQDQREEAADRNYRGILAQQRLQAQEEEKAYQRQKDVYTFKQADAARDDEWRRWEHTQGITAADKKYNADLEAFKYREGATTRELEAEQKRLAIQKAKLDLANEQSGSTFYRNADPVSRVDIFGIMKENLKGFNVKDLSDDQKNAVLNLARQGADVGYIANKFGYSLKDAPKEHFWSSAKPDESRAGIKWSGAITQPPNQPIPQPAQDDGMARYQAMASEFQQKASTDPNWIDSLSDEQAQAYSDALDIVEGKSKPKPSMPSQPIQEQPVRGQIVTDSELVKTYKDTNGDGAITRDEVEAQVAKARKLIAWDEDAKKNNAVARSKITDKTRAAIENSKLIIKAYDSVYKKQAQEAFSNAR